MSLRVWLCDLTYTQQVISSEVMPAAIGEIAGYCEAHLSPPPVFRLFKYPDKLIEALRAEQPHVLGFSNYVWNTRLSYEFAKVVKARFPRTIVVMGGPNFPLGREQQETCLRTRPAIDFFIEKEGETAFCNLIGSLVGLDFDVERVKEEALASVRAVTVDGRFCAGTLTERLRDLSAIPSPYLNGKMDEFFDGKLMPILQTTRGCPFSCTYCVEGTPYYAKVFRKPAQTLKAEIDCIGKKMKELRGHGRRNDFFIADSNFGMFKQDVEFARWIGDALDRYDWPDYIVCSTGKNQHERVMKVSELVRGRIRVSGSVQSTDPAVLENVRRKNVNIEQIFRLAEDANKIGAESHSEVILGLPGDSAERHIKSISDLMDVGFTNIRMYQLILLMGTPMHAQAEEEPSRFGFGTSFRVIPFDYGNYAFDDHTRIVTAEIEEIVTSLKELPFEDYLRCRVFALVVDTFYNQGVFQALLKLLEDLEVPRSAWIRKVWERMERSRIAPLVEAFLAETKGELWTSLDDLERFTSRPENIARFLSGELGGKLIFKYKAILSHEYLADLAGIARVTVLDAVREAGQHDEHIPALVDDLLTYEVLRKVNLFKGDYAPKLFTLTYDVDRFLKNDARWESVSELKCPEPRKCRFYLEDRQIEAIERALNTYGRDLAAMTKIISFMRVENFYRQFEYCHDGG